MKTGLRSIHILIVLAAAVLGVASQSTSGKSNKRPASKPTAAATATPKPTPAPEPEVPAAKRNGRPVDTPANSETPARQKGQAAPVYYYTFTRPGFTYSRIEIEHDEAGKGTISMMKGTFDEPIVDPIELSSVTLVAIKGAAAELNFLQSTEEYQVARDYSHMGNIEFRMKKDGRERTVKFNWTENKSAKLIMDEYRRVSNEYTWRFEIDLARKNQPLLTPGLMDLADSYYKRSEFSDPPHLVPFLTELSLDERLPLMARNRATKMIKEIEKTKK